MMRDETARRRDGQQLRWMRAISLLEGTTLILLVFVAVPLKHLGGYPAWTATMGPIHGMAFLLYVWALAQTSASLDWSKREIIRLFVFACIPFGAFVNERTLKRKEACLTLYQAAGIETYRDRFSVPAGRRKSEGDTVYR